MEAVAAVGTITALVGTCATVAKSLNDIRSKYNRAEITITAIANECTLMPTSLFQVARLIERDPQSFSAKMSTSTGTEAISLDIALQSAIDSSAMTMSLLQDNIKKCSTKSPSGIIPWRNKTRFLWNEADMRDHLDTVRRLQQAIGTVITIIQAYRFHADELRRKLIVV